MKSRRGGHFIAHLKGRFFKHGVSHFHACWYRSSAVPLRPYAIAAAAVPQRGFRVGISHHMPFFKVSGDLPARSFKCRGYGHSLTIAVPLAVPSPRRHFDIYGWPSLPPHIARRTDPHHPAASERPRVEDNGIRSPVQFSPAPEPRSWTMLAWKRFYVPSGPSDNADRLHANALDDFTLYRTAPPPSAAIPQSTFAHTPAPAASTAYHAGKNHCCKSLLTCVCDLRR